MVLEKTLESSLDCKEIQPVHPKGNQSWLFIGTTVKLKLQYFGHFMRRADSFEKTLMLGKIEGRRRRTEDEMVGWHHWLYGHEFEWTPGVGDGQGGLACCNSWSLKESDTTEQLKWTEMTYCRTRHFKIIIFPKTEKTWGMILSHLCFRSLFFPEGGEWDWDTFQWQ